MTFFQFDVSAFKMMSIDLYLKFVCTGPIQPAGYVFLANLESTWCGLDIQGFKECIIPYSSKSNLVNILFEAEFDNFRNYLASIYGGLFCFRAFHSTVF